MTCQVIIQNALYGHCSCLYDIFTVRIWLLLNVTTNNLKDNPPVPVVPVTATAKKPGKKSNRPTGDIIMRFPNELVPLMQTVIDRLYNNPASGTVDLKDIQKFIDEDGKLL